MVVAVVVFRAANFCPFVDALSDDFFFPDLRLSLLSLLRSSPAADPDRLLPLWLLPLCVRCPLPLTAPTG